MTAQEQPCWLAVVVRDETGQVLVARWDYTQAWDLPAGLLRVGETYTAVSAGSWPGL